MSRQKNSEGVWLGGGGDSPLILLIFFRSPTSYRIPRGVGLLEDMSSFLCPGGLGTPDFE